MGRHGDEEAVSTRTVAADSASAARGFLVAIAATASAVFVRWLIDPWMTDHLLLATVYGAVALSAWHGGYRPALLAVIMGYVACDWLFIEPRGSLGIENLRHLI